MKPILNSGGELTIELTVEILNFLRAAKVLEGLTSEERQEVERISDILDVALSQTGNGKVFVSKKVLETVLEYALRNQEWISRLIKKLDVDPMGE